MLDVGCIPQPVTHDRDKSNKSKKQTAKCSKSNY
jgi:hypothetical protein